MSNIIGYSKPANNWEQRTAISSKKKSSGEPLYIPLTLDRHNELCQITYTALSKDDLDLEYTFDDELTFSSIGKGRSAVHFYFHNIRGTCFSMFSKDFEILVKDGKINNAKVIGKFGFVKRGSNIGIKFLG